MTCVIAVGCGYAPERTALEGDASIAGDVAALTDSGPDASDPTTPPVPFHLYVEAKIDGRSNLIIRGKTVTWMHFQFAAPGRETFTNVPTMLDEVAWQPVWPDVPNAENRDCNCRSSTFDALPVGLPTVPSMVTVTHVKGRRTTTPSAIELPTSANDFTLVLEFSDIGLGGSDIYGANIDVVPN